MKHPYDSLEYETEVTRTEVYSVTNQDLDRERVFRRGQQDRKAGLPCQSSCGPYLNGWYAPDSEAYYIHKDATHLL